LFVLHNERGNNLSDVFLLTRGIGETSSKTFRSLPGGLLLHCTVTRLPFVFQPAPWLGLCRSTQLSTQHDYLGDFFVPEEILHEALHTFLGAKDPVLRSRNARLEALAHGGCNDLGRGS